VKLATNICHASVNSRNCWRDCQGHGVRCETNTVMTIEILLNSIACELLKRLTYYARNLDKLFNQVFKEDKVTCV